MDTLQSAAILMGVDVIIRDTLLSSMHLGEQALLSMELTEKNRPMQKSAFIVTILKR
ncbi:hypothetical protein [Marinobacter sp. ELB17]|uniref:hypothetical protein n=1 Tax=Marinobacter sp. ELB17 TaxID=270374 RepID=UPI0000F39BBC|nr:hypothetical protein [Marinobacter sp. ELB17]EAZ99717.1 hypothetical protein MELB17_11956 [Marinobacter sp. ELB17]